MVDIKNNVGEVLFKGNREEAEIFLENIKKIPAPPEARTINYSGFTFFGFKPTKVKHVLLIIIYLISLFLSFIIMVETQSSEGLSAIWFIGNVFTFGLIMMIKGIIYLIKNWNNPI